MKVIFRADGNSEIGLGHIMRSAAVMQMIQHKYDCEFWTSNPEYFPRRDFDKSPVIKLFEYNNLETESSALTEQAPNNSIIVLDGYQFNTAYQIKLKEAGFKVVCVDDIMAYHFVADAVINHAGGIAVDSYSVESYCKLYLGPRYSLVKPLFYQSSKANRNFNDKQVLISLGGADPQNDTEKILQILLANRYFNGLHIVLGAANNKKDYLEERYGNQNEIFFYEKLTSAALYALMNDCPFAILSPSTICYEYMTLGGAVYLYQIADNQSRIRKYLVDEGLAFEFSSLGNSVDIDKALLLQKTIFDRKAPDRILSIFSEITEDSK